MECKDTQVYCHNRDTTIDRKSEGLLKLLLMIIYLLVVKRKACLQPETTYRRAIIKFLQHTYPVNKSIRAMACHTIGGLNRLGFWASGRKSSDWPSNFTLQLKT